MLLPAVFDGLEKLARISAYVLTGKTDVINLAYISAMSFAHEPWA